MSAKLLSIYFCLLWILSACVQQDSTNLGFASSNYPTGSASLTVPALYTTSKDIGLTLNSSNATEFAFFTDGSCNWKTAKWLPYSTSTSVRVPDSDGKKSIKVLFRNAAHFNSGDCSEVQIVLDTTKPTMPGTVTFSNTSLLTATPLFSFAASFDAGSGVDHYEARVVDFATEAIIADWVNLGVGNINQQLTSLNLTERNTYAIQVRAFDKIGNISDVTKSAAFTAGPLLQMTDINFSTQGGVYSVSVSLSSPAIQNVSMIVHTEDGTAISGTDYRPMSGKVITIPAGSSSGSFLIDILDNPTPGPQRTFQVVIDSVTNAAPITNSMNIGVPVGSGSFVTDFIGIATGLETSCGINSAGKTYCWGSNSYGEMGNGASSAVKKPSAVLVPSMPQAATQITMGEHTSCVILADKTVACWGYDGVGGFNYSPTVVPGLTNAVYISAMTYTFCTVNASGNASCWGDNTYGQIDASKTDHPTAFLITGLSGVTQITQQSQNTCALLSTGRVSCWGATINATPVDMGISDVTDIASGINHTCAVNSSGQVLCWGDNATLQLGQPSPVVSSWTTPLLLPQFTSAQKIFAGGSSTCALKIDQSLWCWGKNSTGLTGSPFYGNQDTATQVLKDSNIKTVSISPGFHTCAVLTNGHVTCWGGNSSSGLLGGGYLYNKRYYFPIDPSFIGNIGLISNLTLSHAQTCYKSSEGTSCWGFNYVDYTLNLSNVFQTFYNYLWGSSANSPSVTDSVAGANHRCLLYSNGSVKCHGGNDVGQLGNGTTTDSSALVSVNLPAGVLATRISAGMAHTCVDGNDGKVYCWGFNHSGQLGYTTSGIEYSRSPQAVTGVGLQQVRANFFTTCALRTSDGNLVCWGSNKAGVFGNGTTANSTSTPVLVPLPGPPKKFDIGTQHACAIYGAGNALYCWGSNAVGQLGLGDLTDRTSPTLLSGVTNVQSIALSATHTCAIDSNSRIWCWGYNGAGELGINNVAIPMQKTPLLLPTILGGATKIGVSSTTVFNKSSNYDVSNVYSTTCAVIHLGDGYPHDSLKCWGGNGDNIGSRFSWSFAQGVPLTYQ